MPRKRPAKTPTLTLKSATAAVSVPIDEVIRQWRRIAEAQSRSDNPALRIAGEAHLRKIDGFAAQALREQAARSKPKMHPKIAAALADIVARHKAAGIKRGTVAAIGRELALLGYSVDRQTIKEAIAGRYFPTHGTRNR